MTGAWEPGGLNYWSPLAITYPAHLKIEVRWGQSWQSNCKSYLCRLDLIDIDVTNLPELALWWMPCIQLFASQLIARIRKDWTSWLHILKLVCGGFLRKTFRCFIKNLAPKLFKLVKTDQFFYSHVAWFYNSPCPRLNKLGANLRSLIWSVVLLTFNFNLFGFQMALE